MDLSAVREVSEVLMRWAGAPMGWPLGVKIAAAALVLGLAWVLSRGRYDDPHGPHADERSVKTPVKRLKNPGLSKHLVRVPYVVWWPLLGTLYAGVHVLLAATTGTGKSKAMLFWSLAYHVMHWRSKKLIRHLQVYDPKGEFFEFLLRLYNRFGWHYFVYSALTEHPVSAALNLVADRTMAEVAALAMWPEEEGQGGHFNKKSRQVFLAGCEVTDYRGVWAVYELVRDAEALEASCERYPALRRAYMQIQERERSSVLSTITGVLSQLENPLVARIFQPDPDTEQPEYSSWEVPCSSHVCIDWEQGQGMAALTSALQEVLHHVGLRAGHPSRGRKRGPGTYVYLDEATSGGLRARKVMSYFGAGRGSRVYTLIVSQDMEQGYEVMGRSAYRSAAANAHIKVFGQSDDPETQQYASTQSGMTVLRLAPDESAPPPPLGDGEQRQAKPTAVKTVLRERLLAHHVQELEWAEFLVISRPPRPKWHRHLPKGLRRRLGQPRKVEVVQGVSIEDYEHLVLPSGERYGGWRYHGVPYSAFRQLAMRLVAEREGGETWENPWVSERLKRLARELKETRRPAPVPDPPAEHPKPENPPQGSSWTVGVPPPDPPAAAGVEGVECWYCGLLGGAETCEECGTDLRREKGES